MSTSDASDQSPPGDGTQGEERSTDPEQPAADLPLVVGSPDQSWRVLGLVNDWIKHAETKAAGTLAAAGVSAGVLYNLVKDLNHPGLLIDVLTFACATGIVLGGLCAAWALRPRLWSREEPTSNLYFHHIARKHPKKDKGADYLPALGVLTTDDAALVNEIAGQVWANAHVAKAKFQAANLGLTFVLLAIILLGATACAVASHTW